MWQGPGFSRMLVLSSLRTPIKHTPYLWPQREDQPRATQVGVRALTSLTSHYDLLFVSMEGGKGETLALVFPEEFTLLQADVMHLIG